MKSSMKWGVEFSLLSKYQQGYLRLALPKGRLLAVTANLLAKIGLGFKGYNARARLYRLRSTRFSYLSAKMFQEKDIPVQVAVGNYDLGICGLDWVEELQVGYPATTLVKVMDLGYGRGNLYVAARGQGGISNIDEVLTGRNSWRIVSEYPNLAESFALNQRLRSFRIFPVWGAAEVYPPENADLAVLWARGEERLASYGLTPLKVLLATSAFLIANERSLEAKDLNEILACFSPEVIGESKSLLEAETEVIGSSEAALSRQQRADSVWLALPDGHQQPPTVEFLSRVRINVEGYSEEGRNRRPSTDFDWLSVKVVRPQDMPLQVANGNFDLAISGKDWLLDHLYRFPSSPVAELADLGFGRVKIVAVVSKQLPVTNIGELRQLAKVGRLSPLRVASEYINIADKYLRDNRVSPYKLIPTWGASEAFLPEDADLLIENSQTGRTLARHDLRVIDTLFESRACLIGNINSIDSLTKKGKVASLIEILRQAAEGG